MEFLSLHPERIRANVYPAPIVLKRKQKGKREAGRKKERKMEIDSLTSAVEKPLMTIARVFNSTTNGEPIRPAYFKINVYSRLPKY